MVACVDTMEAFADSCAANGKAGDTKMHLWPLLFSLRYIGFDETGRFLTNAESFSAFIRHKKIRQRPKSLLVGQTLCPRQCVDV